MCAYVCLDLNQQITLNMSTHMLNAVYTHTHTKIIYIYIYIISLKQARKGDYKADINEVNKDYSYFVKQRAGIYIRFPEKNILARYRLPISFFS